MAQNQGENPDQIWVFVGLIIVVLLITHFFGNNIKAFYLLIQHGWILLYKYIFMVLPLDFPKSLAKIEELMDIYTASEFTKTDLSKMAKVLRPYEMIPLGTIFALYAYSVAKKNPGNSFKRVFSRQSLCKSEVREWPWIAPILSLDLAKESIDTGRWAMCKTPFDFCKKYNLLDGFELNRQKARKLFASQLGNLWEGPEKLKIHEKALYACFCAQACRNKDGAVSGLKTLALSIAEGKPDYSWVDGLIKEHENDPRVVDITLKHAYVVTVLTATLEEGRTNGVLPPAYFLWLRPLNRALWYSLNGVGRRVAFTEIAGIHSHRLAEKIAGHPIERPYVDKAVQALEKALTEVKMDKKERME